MVKLSVWADTVVASPQAALRVAFSVIVWSFAMPLIGFLIFAAMTIIPFIFVLFAPISWFFGSLYLTGFVPSVVTALFFQAILRRTKPLIVVLATGLVSTLSANLWWATMIYDTPAKFVDPSSYAYWALMAGAFGAAVVMALHGLLRRPR